MLKLTTKLRKKAVREEAAADSGSREVPPHQLLQRRQRQRRLRLGGGRGRGSAKLLKLISRALTFELSTQPPRVRSPPWRLASNSNSNSSSSSRCWRRNGGSGLHKRAAACLRH
jgi:hypothetical protein